MGAQGKQPQNDVPMCMPAFAEHSADFQGLWPFSGLVAGDLKWSGTAAAPSYSGTVTEAVWVVPPAPCHLRGDTTGFGGDHQPCSAHGSRATA